MLEWMHVNKWKEADQTKHSILSNGFMLLWYKKYIKCNNNCISYMTRIQNNTSHCCISSVRERNSHRRGCKCATALILFSSWVKHFSAAASSWIYVWPASLHLPLLREGVEETHTHTWREQRRKENAVSTCRCESGQWVEFWIIKGYCLKF